MKTHTEDIFEKLIVEHLVLHSGYEPRNQTRYDPDDALATDAGFDVQRALIPTEVDGFAAAFFKLKGEQNLADNAKLNAWLDPGGECQTWVNSLSDSG